MRCGVERFHNRPNELFAVLCLRFTLDNSVVFVEANEHTVLMSVSLLLPLRIASNTCPVPEMWAVREKGAGF